MERCLAQAESHFIFRLQTIGGFGGKSDQLNAYNMFLGDPGYFGRDLERYRGATSEALRSAAARWLLPSPARRPQRRPARPSGSRARKFAAGGGVVMIADRSRLPVPGPERPFRFPTIVRQTARERASRDDGRAPSRAARQRAAARAGGRVRRPGRSTGPRRDHRGHARRRLRRSFGARRPRSARAGSAHSSRPTSGTTPPSSA